MKAFEIISELTVGDYQEKDGVFQTGEVMTFERQSDMLFGFESPIVYWPHSEKETADKKPRKFIYLYNDRFQSRDSDIYAIIKHGNDLVYIYEIE